jgi:hypothetical protein
MFSFMNPGKSKPAKKGLKIIIVGCGKVGTTLVVKRDMTLSLLTRMRKKYRKSRIYTTLWVS